MVKVRQYFERKIVVGVLSGFWNGLCAGLAHASMLRRLDFFCASYFRCASKLISFSCNSIKCNGTFTESHGGAEVFNYNHYQDHLEILERNPHCQREN